MKNNRLTPTQIKLKKVLRPIVEGILKKATPDFKNELGIGVEKTWVGINEMEAILRFKYKSVRHPLFQPMLQLKKSLEDIENWLDKSDY
jgi:hypothetical protein